MEDYSDDELDELNDTVLQELEDNAIQFTQAQQQSQAHRPPPPPPRARPLQPRVSNSTTYVDLTGFEADDLDDALVEDELAKQPTVVAPTAVGRPLPPQQARVLPGGNRPPQPTWQQQQQRQQQQRQRQPQQQQQQQQQQPQGRPGQPHTRWQLPQDQPQFGQHQPHLAQSSNHASLADRTTQYHSQRYPSRPVPPQRLAQTRPPQPVPSQVGGLTPALLQQPQPSQAPRAASGVGDQTEIIARLQAQVSALTSELTSAKGEASIVRSKYEKAQTTHDQEVTRLKRLNAEQLAQQEQAVEAALVAEKNATTELQFARQDLEETIGRAKVKRKDGVTATPRKKSRWAAGDGFDDVELVPSPGKGKRRGDSGGVAIPLAERTPTKGKRKRPAVDSPAMALEVQEDVPMPDAPAQVKANGKDKEKANPAARSRSRHRDFILPFDFLKLILDHSPAHGQPLTFDLFSRYAFPSDPSQSLAAIILDKLPDLGKSSQDRAAEDESVYLLVDFCELVLDMWSQCLNEKYFAPVYDIASLVSFTLQLNTMAIVPHIIPGLLPLLQTTCILLALPRFESPSGDISTHLNGSLRQLSAEINVTQSLSLLYLAALACVGPSHGTPWNDPGTSGDSSPSPFRTQAEFWKHIQLEFILIMLSPKQPEEDFFGVLSLLCTSVLADSIGPIPNSSLTLLPPQLRQDDQSPEFAARSLVNRISEYLPNPPKWAPRNSLKQYRVQLAILRTLLAFAKSPFGAVQMAASAFLIPRMVVVLCWAIDKLYDMDVPPALLKWKPINGKEEAPEDSESVTERGDDNAQRELDPDATQAIPDTDAPKQTKGGGDNNEPEPPETEQPDTDADKTALLNQVIAQVTALLHYLITDPRTANMVNLPAKLAASHGGAYRYQITLARLTFAEEDLVLEAGIDSRTVELAHELLELAVTPDEGEGIGDVFVPQP